MPTTLDDIAAADHLRQLMSGPKGKLQKKYPLADSETQEMDNAQAEAEMAFCGPGADCSKCDDARRKKFQERRTALAVQRTK